jgi:hypothetical protein
MNTARIVFLVFLILAFIAGGYVYSFVDMKKQIERMGGITDKAAEPTDAGNSVAGKTSASNASACPDLLIQQGKLIYLYNTKRPEKVGENPILFNNLDEYISYRDLSGGECPILFLQSAYNTQGKQVYNVTNINPALPLPGTTIGSLPLTASLKQPPGPIKVEEVKVKKRAGNFATTVSHLRLYGISISKTAADLQRVCASR